MANIIKIDRARLRKLHAAGCSDSVMAAAFDCHRANIARARWLLGLPPNGPSQPLAPPPRLCPPGMADREIRARFGLQETA